MKIHGYFVLAAASAAVLCGTCPPVRAQALPVPGFQLGGGKELSPEEKAKLEAGERAAKAAQASVPTPKASNDPWASVRSSEETPTKSKKTKSVR